MLLVAFVIANDAALQLCKQERNCNDLIQLWRTKSHVQMTYTLLVPGIYYRLTLTPSDVLVNRRHLKER